MTLRHDWVTTDFDGRLANIVRAYEGDTSNEAGTIRWVIANLQHARAALAELAKFADPTVRIVAGEGREEVPDADSK